MDLHGPCDARASRPPPTSRGSLNPTRHVSPTTNSPVSSRATPRNCALFVVSLLSSQTQTGSSERAGRSWTRKIRGVQRTNRGKEPGGAMSDMEVDNNNQVAVRPHEMRFRHTGDETGHEDRSGAECARVHPGSIARSPHSVSESRPAAPFRGPPVFAPRSPRVPARGRLDSAFWGPRPRVRGNGVYSHPSAPVAPRTGPQGSRFGTPAKALSPPSCPSPASEADPGSLSSLRPRFTDETTPRRRGTPPAARPAAPRPLPAPPHPRGPRVAPRGQPRGLPARREPAGGCPARRGGTRPAPPRGRRAGASGSRSRSGTPSPCGPGPSAPTRAPFAGE